MSQAAFSVVQVAHNPPSFERTACSYITISMACKLCPTSLPNCDCRIADLISHMVDDFKVWDGVYELFAEARGSVDAFEGDIWLDKITERARSAIASSEEGTTIASVAETKDYALPFVAALAARPQKSLRILDFGGGLATSYLPLINMLPSGQPLDFVIVENEKVCTRGKDLFGSDKRLCFRADVPTSREKFDIVHCGSSLHYVDDFVGMLDRFVSLEPEYLLFADLPAAENRTFVTAQMFHGRRIPVRFWNLGEFVTHVKKLGYGMIFGARFIAHFTANETVRCFAHFPKDYRLNHFSQLVFKRRV